jgi:prepilin-type N-terminal cleavage/methylation domain-containing protein
MFKLFVRNIRKSKKGFTLTELIVVVAILGVLAGVATPMVIGRLDEARDQADQVNAKLIEDAIARAVASGDLTLGTTIDADDIENAIDEEITSIPEVQGTENGIFLCNRTTGAVSIGLAAAVTGDVVQIEY